MDILVKTNMINLNVSFRRTVSVLINYLLLLQNVTFRWAVTYHTSVCVCVL